MNDDVGIYTINLPNYIAEDAIKITKACICKTCVMTYIQCPCW